MGERVDPKWPHFRARVKDKWGQLTDGDMDLLENRQDELAGLVAKRYGISEEEAKKQVTEFDVGYDYDRTAHEDRP